MTAVASIINVASQKRRPRCRGKKLDDGWVQGDYIDPLHTLPMPFRFAVVKGLRRRRKSPGTVLDQTLMVEVFRLGKKERPSGRFLKQDMQKRQSPIGSPGFSCRATAQTVNPGMVAVVN
ncbi:hypothetical protein [Caballeronia sp. M23-90]